MKKKLLLPWVLVSLFFGISLQANAQVSLPFFEDFEGGGPDTTFMMNQPVLNGLFGTGYAWSYDKTLDARLRMRAWQDWGLSAPFTTSGINAITLDDSASNGNVPLNNLILTIDMSSYIGDTSIQMDFNMSHHGEEVHPNDRVFIRGSVFDTVWIELFNLNSVANFGNTGIWQSIENLDLDAALNGGGQSFTNTTQIRFGQEDNFPATSPNVSDGFTFDDVFIYQLSDASAEARVVTSPRSGCGLGVDTVCFSYGNVGLMAFDSAQVYYSINGGTPIMELDTSTVNPGDTTEYCFTTLGSFSAVGNYTVQAWVKVPGDSIPIDDTVTVSITNIAVVSTYPYIEDFENGANGWLSGGPNSSWALATPANPTINSAASGVNSWITNATGPYNTSEASSVVSPCFDFSTLVAPAMRISVWWNTESPWDGAVIQSSIDDGLTWQNVGAFGGVAGNPVNWYNEGNIFGNPGGQSEGWSGRGGSGSGGWLVAEHDLLGLGGQSSVLIRVAFGSDGSVQDDGFAFDDVNIFEKPPRDGQILGVVSPITSCSLGLDTVCVAYINNGSVPLDSTTVSYTINGGTVISELDTTTLQPGDTAVYCFTTLGNFSAVGIYDIGAWISVPGDGLALNDSVVFTIENLVVVDTFPYCEDFENGPGSWVSGGINNTWQYGQPVGAVIDTAASGLYAWVTDTANSYNNSENSFVISPCIDMSSLVLPIVSANVWWDAESSWDGTVLQATIDDGLTWFNIGNFGDPNWYTDTTINGNPGGQQIGWSNVSGVGSGGWVNARRVVRSLGGQPKVRFRFAFGSDGSVNFDDGFAFDDFKITDSPPVDANILAALSPVTSCGLGQEQVGFQYMNSGILPLDSAVMQYSINGGPFVTEIDPRTLAPGDTTIYPFLTLGNFSTVGVYTIQVIVTAAGDTVQGNDTLLFTVTHVPEISSFPYLDDFEAGPGGWTVGGNGNWQWGLPRGNTIDTAASGVKAWMTDTLNNYTNEECTFVLSPCFDFSTLRLPIVRANIWTNTEEFFFSSDGVVLQATTDSGLTWVNVGTSSSPNWYNNANVSGLNNCLGTSDGWSGSTDTSYTTVEHEIAFLAGEPDVRFRFFFGSDFFGNAFDGFAFDDFEIRDLPPNDVGVVQVIEPTSGACGDSNAVVTIVVRNFGSDDQTNFPITFIANSGGSTAANINYTYTDTLMPGVFDTIMIGTFNTYAGGTFDLTSYSGLLNDAGINNDTTFVGGVFIQPIPDAPIVADTVICFADTVILAAPLDTNLVYTWYDSATGGNVLIDSTHLTAFVTRDTTFYVEARSGAGGPCLRISEVDLGAPDFVEIQNLGGNPVDATGYVVAVSDSYTDINFVNSTLWNLGQMAAGQVMYRDDSNGSPQFWGSNLFFNPGAFPQFAGWAMIIDNTGTVIDAVFWGWPAGDIANFNTVINGFTITGSDMPWSGDGVNVSALPADHIALSGGTEFNDATDWDITQSVNSPGVQNTSLSFPYKCQSDGCSSPRTPVRVLIRPLSVDLGSDRAVCEGTVVDGTTPGGVSYLWNTTATTPMINVSLSGQYVLTVTNQDGCVGNDTINLLVQPNPVVNLGPADTAGCGSLLLDAGNPGSQYAWSVPNSSQTLLVTTPGQYSVNVTNPSGCTVSDTINVSILPLPTVNLGPDVSECEEAVLDAGSFPAGFSYLWSTNATTQTIAVNTTGLFSVTVTDTAGCSATDDIIVSILPPAMVDLGPDRTECDSAILDAGPFNSYTWSTNDMTQQITVKTGGTYYVDVLDNNGCTGTDTVVVGVEESPAAAWSALWTSATDVQFTNASTPATGVTYLWDFGDGNTSSLQNPSHSYAVAGNYIVSLTVTSQNCGDDASDRLIGTDLEDEAFGRTITLFPNPSNGMFALGISGLRADQLHVTVSDVTGKTVMSIHEDQPVYGNYEQVIDLSNHAKGVYMVTVFDGNRYARKKMIVK